MLARALALASFSAAAVLAFSSAVGFAAAALAVEALVAAFFVVAFFVVVFALVVFAAAFLVDPEGLA